MTLVVSLCLAYTRSWPLAKALTNEISLNPILLPAHHKRRCSAAVTSMFTVLQQIGMQDGGSTPQRAGKGCSLLGVAIVNALLGREEEDCKVCVSELRRHGEFRPREGDGLVKLLWFAILEI